MERLTRSPMCLAIFVIMVLAEMVWRVRSGRDYDARTEMAQLGVALGGLPFAAVIALVIAAAYSLIWQHAFVDWPPHHRVHHASNATYLDCNYGGVVIIFERLFGTFRAQRREEPLRYGLADEQPSNNPV